MKTICLYFEIHQNIHLKRYRFFDIGTDHYYYDDYENECSITNTVEHSYLPALQTLLQMIKENPGFFKVAFSISGCAIVGELCTDGDRVVAGTERNGVCGVLGGTLFPRLVFPGQ